MSRFTKESTSIERQGEIIETWARAHGHEIVGWADDVDFSRGTMPFEAPEFGPWLNDPEKIPQYDIVAVWKLDRLGAGSIILNALLSWAEANDKTIVSVTENLDFSSWVGRLVANVLAGVAEGEWEAIKERTAGSAAKLRGLRRWPGGTAPFGYKPEPMEEAGWRLALEEREAELVRHIGEKVIEGHSVNGICRWLDTTEFRPRRGGHWGPAVVTRMLRSRWILGQKTHKGAVILENDGMPAQFAPPIFATPEGDPDYQRWQEIQTALDNRKVQKKRAHGTAMLLNVAKCECGEWLYQWVLHRRGKDYRYYRCSGKIKRRNDCSRPGLKAEQLESTVEELFLGDLGNYERTEKVFIAGTGFSAELERVDLAIESIRKERDLGLYDGDDDGYFSRLQSLMERRRKIASVPVQEARWEQQGVGETYREAWERMGAAERREMLMDHGITVTATADPLQVGIFVPVDTVRKRLPDYEPPTAAAQ